MSVGAKEVSRYVNSGDCADLVHDYLEARGVAYIISPALTGRQCDWSFKGNTLADFETWCRSNGLRCGGNPYEVKFDSVYDSDGNWTTRQRAEALARESRKADSIARRQDSIARYVAPPLPRKRVFVEYLEISRTTAEKLGFSYSEYIGTARFFGYSDLFSVTIQATEQGDTNYIYRNYSSSYDTSLTLFWGGHRQRQTSSSITSSGIISVGYEDEDYGLTFRLNGMHYSYEHSTDYEHSISGDGLLDYGENRIFGTFKSSYELETGVPWFSSIPFVGALFRHRDRTSEWRYIFIRVIVK